MTGNEQLNAVRSQLTAWAAEKTALALIFPGGFFLAGIRGELNQGSGPDRFDFVAFNEVLRVTIALALCRSVSIDRRQRDLTVVRLQREGREIMLSEVRPDIGTAILSEWLN